jgi:hypothetical protein
LIRWFVNRPPDDGGLYYRRTLPLRHLMPRLRAAGVRVRYSCTIDTNIDYDAYFFSRWIRPEYLPLLIEAKRRDKLIIWDVDDDIFGLERIEERHHEKRAILIRTLELCLDMADIITVSTEPLMERARRPEKTVVLPNLIDLADNPPEQRDAGRNAILFTGSPTHYLDVELIRDLHWQTQRAYQWVWYGMRPDWMTCRDIWLPWSRLCEYPRVCRMVRPLVCLAPLVRDRFNLSKSAIKIWETATLGSSVIASDYGPYTGSAAAIAAAGEPITREHLDQVVSQPNHQACLAEAMANSWQESRSGPAQWLAAFLHIASLYSGKSHVDANQLSGSSAA